VRNFVLGMVAALFFLALSGKAHNRPGTEHNRRHAIVYAFCHSLKPCPLGDKALSVAYCESGPNLWPYASNAGTYLGMFQFGPYARSRFGFSWSPWAQARGAYRYWSVAGWGPWQCA
jgi:hypothetical protein